MVDLGRGKQGCLLRCDHASPHQSELCWVASTSNEKWRCRREKHHFRQSSRFTAVIPSQSEPFSTSRLAKSPSGTTSLTPGVPYFPLVSTRIYVKQNLKHSLMRNVRLSSRYNSCWHFPSGNVLSLSRRSMPSSYPIPEAQSLRCRHYVRPVELEIPLTGATTAVLSDLSVPTDGVGSLLYLTRLPLRTLKSPVFEQGTAGCSSRW